jgi:hypothetical protein
MYPLTLVKFKSATNHIVGEHRVSILTDCESAGFTKYAHVALVYAPNTSRPIYAIASEINMVARAIGGGSHFLCVYDDRHYNYGCSDDWADIHKFTQEALRWITLHFTKASENTGFKHAQHMTTSKYEL